MRCLARGTVPRCKKHKTTRYLTVKAKSTEVPRGKKHGGRHKAKSTVAVCSVVFPNFIRNDWSLSENDWLLSEKIQRVTRKTTPSFLAFLLLVLLLCFLQRCEKARLLPHIRSSTTGRSPPSHQIVNDRPNSIKMQATKPERQVALKRQLEIESKSEDELELEREREIEKFETEMFEKIHSVYAPIEYIDGVNSEKLDVLMKMEHSFERLLFEDDYFFDTLQWMFDNARQHQKLELDAPKLSIIKVIVRHFVVRADYCLELAKVIQNKQASEEDELKKEEVYAAFGEVVAFKLMMEPFVLKEEDTGLDLSPYSHFQAITVLYQVVNKAFGIMIMIREMYSQDEEEEQQRPTTSYQANRIKRK